jgi:hypothetical protein
MLFTAICLFMLGLLWGGARWLTNCEHEFELVIHEEDELGYAYTVKRCKVCGEERDT